MISISEASGWIGLILLLISYMQKNYINMRIISIISNFFYLTQGISLNSNSLITGAILSFLMHIYMIFFNKKRDSK